VHKSDLPWQAVLSGGVHEALEGVAADGGRDDGGDGEEDDVQDKGGGVQLELFKRGLLPFDLANKAAGEPHHRKAPIHELWHLANFTQRKPSTNHPLFSTGKRKIQLVSAVQKLKEPKEMVAQTSEWSFGSARGR